MTTDRALLEAAARAAGLDVVFIDTFDALLRNKTALPYLREAGPHNKRRDDKVRWNPLTDDGEALRLAVKLRMTVDADHERGDGSFATVVLVFNGTTNLTRTEEPHAQDPYDATRRAIVRAAAALGESRE